MKNLFWGSMSSIVAVLCLTPFSAGIAGANDSAAPLKRSKAPVISAPTPKLAPHRVMDLPEAETVNLAALQTDPFLDDDPAPSMDGGLSRNFRLDIDPLRAQVSARGFLAVEEELQSALAAAAPERRLDATLQLATLYLSYDLHAEALSVIGEQEDAREHGDFVLLVGIANVKMGRFEDAVETFNDQRLEDSAEARRWRGMANAKRGAYVAASEDLFQQPVGAMSFEDGAAGFLLAKAETAHSLGKLEILRETLKTLRRSALDNAQRAQRALLEAHLLLAQQRNEPGKRELQELVRSGPAPYANMAATELLNHRFHHGTIDPIEAVERVDRLMLTWRGGAFERRALELSARLHDATDDIGAAFKARRQLMEQFPGTDAGAEAAQTMRAALPTLLERSSLSPLDAAQLFYENIDLAPPGRDGDALIRNIADRLAALDLVAQSAELLHHQTFERLRGAQRSQTAADLAALYLADEKPDMALRVLRSTRLARLPAATNNQRRWLEARALTQIGDAPAALTLLQQDQSSEGSKLRGEVYWSAQQWMPAGNAFKAAALLPAAIDEQLDREQSVLVLRAAAAYGLAGAQSELRALGRLASGKLVDTDANHLLEGLAFGGLADNPVAFRAAYRAFFADPATAS